MIHRAGAQSNIIPIQSRPRSQSGRPSAPLREALHLLSRRGSSSWSRWRAVCADLPAILPAVKALISHSTPTGRRRQVRPAAPARGRLLVLAAGLLALATSCASGRRPLVLDSTPRGAVVFVDGVESGHSTPCTIQLPDKSRTISFELDGYRPEEREVSIGDRSWVVYWRDGASSPGSWTFPLWLPMEDFILPIKEDDGEMPSSIHVRMVRQREPLALAN